MDTALGVVAMMSVSALPRTAVTSDYGPILSQLWRPEDLIHV